MSNVVVATEKTDVAQVERLRLAIKEIDTIAHAMEASDQTRAIDVYARAKKSRELITEAVKLRIYAERRAGELAKETGATFDQLTTEFQVRRVDVRRWLTLTMFSEDDIDSAVQHMVELSDTGREPTFTAVYQGLLTDSAQKVDKDIYLLSDGSYRIHWTYRGKRLSKKAGRTLTGAKRQLLMIRTGKKDLETRAYVSPDLSIAYGEIRRALDHIDQRLTLRDGRGSPLPLAGTARERAEEALAHLHSAEDALISAMNEESLSRSPDKRNSAA